MLLSNGRMAHSERFLFVLAGFSLQSQETAVKDQEGPSLHLILGGWCWVTLRFSV